MAKVAALAAASKAMQRTESEALGCRPNHSCRRGSSFEASSEVTPRLETEGGLEGLASGSRRRVTATRFVNYDGLAETLQAAYQGSHRLQVEAQRLNIKSMIGTSQRHKSIRECHRQGGALRWG